MRFTFVALLAAGTAFAQAERQPDPRNPQTKSPPVGYRSAFEDRWNEEVGKPPAKPQPGKPGASGHGSHHK
jgi:hypothetical protein